jgi:predicted TIM-barrel fold metal-dependent hydrolase
MTTSTATAPAPTDAADWRPPAGTRIISVDDHGVEPASFWNEWLPDFLPPADRDRAPRLRGLALEIDGAVARVFKLFPHVAARSEVRAGATDPEARLRDMDAEGVQASFTFSQRAMALFGLQDRGLMVRCIDGYNEWLAGWCARGGGRLYGVAILPTIFQPEATADYIAKLRDLGFHAMHIPSSPRAVAYNRPEMEPLWTAIEESGMPLSFHISESPDDDGPGGLGTYLTVVQQPFRKLWALLVFAGVLERHPDLKVVFTEGGISWIPSALDHTDRIYETFGADLEPKLAHPPSYYWRRQCFATFQDDPRGVEQIAHIGVDKVLWATDYPHPEGTFTRSRALVRDLFERFPTAEAQAIVGGTALRLFDLDPARLPPPAP